MPVKHPLFARVYKRLAACEDKAGGADNRLELLAGLEGRVVEVGAGVGSNFVHYPGTVTEVLAVEPEPYLRGEAQKAAADASVSVRVVDGEADRLPADDGEFDAGIASLVLCSVPDQAVALAELHRVIRPGGQLRFYEHVAESGRKGRIHRFVNPVYTRMAGGCNLTRDTGAAIEAAGFQIERTRSFQFPPGRLSVLHILGTARRT